MSMLKVFLLLAALVNVSNLWAVVPTTQSRPVCCAGDCQSQRPCCEIKSDHSVPSPIPSASFRVSPVFFALLVSQPISAGALVALPQEDFSAVPAWHAPPFFIVHGSLLI